MSMMSNEELTKLYSYDRFYIDKMNIRPFFLLSFLATVAVSLTPFSDSTLTCSEIPQAGSINENLQFLWGKAIMGDVDRFAYLIFSPLLIIFELTILKFYHSNPKILGQPGILYCVIIAFELLLNVHFLASAAYFTANQQYTTMPSSYPSYCTANAILVTFCETLHFIFLLMVPLYIVYVLRRTLKSNTKIWTLVYIIVFVISGCSTYFMWQEQFLGLNIFGLCSLTFIRAPNQSPIIPVLPIISNAIFVIAGIFTIQYYKRHMPNSLGLRKKRHIQKQILLIYVCGYSIFWFADSIMDMLLYFKCQNDLINSNLAPIISIRNCLNILQCFLIFIIIFKIQNVRRAFKRFLRKTFSRAQSQSALRKLSSLTTDESSSKHEDYFNFEEVLLDIKVQRNQIDILKISQVVTLVSGIYIAYKQYYNILDHEYFNPFIASVSDLRPRMIEEEEGRRKKHNFRTTKKIYFHERMSIKLDDQITKEFIIDLSLLPKLGILECTMVIHAPKVFQIMLESDNLAQIYSSFQLRENTRKMFDIVQGSGGKSGQFFFFSKDNKYVLKTITQQQFEFIDKNLIYFYEHFVRNPNSVLAKVYGLFTFHGHEIQRTYHLILMKNILACRNDQIIRTYDMKGSTDNREVNKEGEIEANELKKTTLKDIDFIKDQGKIHIENHKKLKLREIIMKDTIFLKSLNLLDYSLLVVRVKWEVPPKNQDFWGEYQRIASSIDEKEFYHIGIIDYLQRWDLQKRGQKWWKKLIGKKDVSAQQPKYYQQRFISFVTDITKLIPSFQNSPFRSFRQSRKRRLSSNVSLMKPLFKDVTSLEEECEKKSEDIDNLSQHHQKKKIAWSQHQMQESNQSSRYTKEEQRIIEIQMQQHQPRFNNSPSPRSIERPHSQHFFKQIELLDLGQPTIMRSAYTIHD